jgi:Ca-activated chloride channel family protein
VVCAVLLAAANARGQALVHAAPDLPSTPLRASAAADAGSAVFRSGIDLVALNVVVTDLHQQFVSGLDAQDFAVFEDGVAQDVSFFSAARVPLDLAILLDTSASMSDKMQNVQGAAIGFAASLRDGDRAMVVDIKDATRVLQPLSGDLSAATAAIRSTKASGGTGLYNGLYLTLRELEAAPPTGPDVRRQAIVVLSDGDDTTSLVTFDDVMDAAKRAGIAIYTIGLRSEWQDQQPGPGRRDLESSEYSMKALAVETGGRAFFPRAIAELDGVYTAISDELANEYAIGYVPKSATADGRYHRVTVRLPERPEVRARTRAGYTATRAR